jgi:hypothetical protein
MVVENQDGVIKKNSYEISTPSGLLRNYFFMQIAPKKINLSYEIRQNDRKIQNGVENLCFRIFALKKIGFSLSGAGHRKLSFFFQSDKASL